MTILFIIVILFILFYISKQEDINIEDNKQHPIFNHYHQFNITILSELEYLGELYNDEDQKYIERHGIILCVYFKLCY